MVNNEQQATLLIDSLQPSALYRIQIVAKSRAGEGPLSIPYQLRTLDRQVPQFKIFSSDPFCLNDQSCLIKWTIESDGSSPISRTEMTYARVMIILFSSFFGISMDIHRFKMGILWDLGVRLFNWNH